MHVADPMMSSAEGIDPEHEALLADSVGLGLLVLFNTLNPSERLVFVLYDLFAVPFDEIAPIVGRSTTATRQLASRARRRVQGVATDSYVDLTPQRVVINAFLVASRGGDFDALLAVPDPDVVISSLSDSLAYGRFRGGSQCVGRGQAVLSANPRDRFGFPLSLFLSGRVHQKLAE